MTDSTTPSAEPASTEEWRNIARVPDLYFHILSWPEKKQGGWTAEEFYGTGESEWADFKHHWKHYSPRLGGTCVEIGCGAGRMTRALAADFDRVVALDVSADMISQAQKVVPDNVQFEQVGGTTIPLPDGAANAVFSVIVLQHLETFEDVRGYVEDAYRALAPGGSAMLNISLAHKPRGLVERARTEFGIWRSRRGLRRGKVHELVRWREYPWEQVMATMREIGYTDIQLRMFPVRSNGWQHQFWFVTKPETS
jgi:SAM-dependent methyltransferase